MRSIASIRGARLFARQQYPQYVLTVRMFSTDKATPPAPPEPRGRGRPRKNPETPFKEPLKRRPKIAYRNGDILDPRYGGVEGRFSADQLKLYEKKGYKSILYLCTDQADDFGFEGGFRALQASAPNLVMKHVPFNTLSRHINSQDPAAYEMPWLRIFDYKRIEEAMDSLPGPTLVSCRSSYRSSAAYSVYQVSISSTVLLLPVIR